mgnify:CR=1 FL=1
MRLTTGAGPPELRQYDADDDGLDDWNDPDHGGYHYDDNTPDPLDHDGDGVPNCNDSCPADPNKTLPGVCGCGTPDTDSDGGGHAPEQPGRRLRDVAVFILEQVAALQHFATVVGQLYRIVIHIVRSNDLLSSAAHFFDDGGQ